MSLENHPFWWYLPRKMVIFYGYHCFLRGYRIYRRYYQDGKSRKKSILRILTSILRWVVSPGFAPNTHLLTPPKKHVTCPMKHGCLQDDHFSRFEMGNLFGWRITFMFSHGNPLIFQFPKYLEPTSELPIYQVTIPLVNQIYREIEDEGIIWVIWPV